MIIEVAIVKVKKIKKLLRSQFSCDILLFGFIFILLWQVFSHEYSRFEQEGAVFRELVISLGRYFPPLLPYTIDWLEKNNGNRF